MQRFLPVLVVSIVLLTACGDDDPGESPAATASLEITASAGPVCPVESDPPAPECAPRRVDAATIIVTGAEGTEIARGTTAADGTVLIQVAPGDLMVVPQPVEGLLGTAPAVMVTVTEGQTVPVAVGYDTGIR